MSNTNVFYFTANYSPIIANIKNTNIYLTCVNTFIFSRSTKNTNIKVHLPASNSMIYLNGYLESSVKTWYMKSALKFVERT